MTTSSPDRDVFLERWADVLPPRALGFRIKMLSQASTAVLEKVFAPFEITEFHFQVLACLWKEDGLPISVIVEQLGQVAATLTGVIDRMEARGLVRRERDVNDRRIWRIWLTDQGLALRDRLPVLIENIVGEILQGVDPEELAIFSKLLDRLTEGCLRIAAR